MTILVDTSALVEYDRATGSHADRRMADLIASGTTVATTEPVMMEALSGARDDVRERDLRRMLRAFDLLPFDPVTDFEGAARVYRLCRKAGVTPRGLIDCMIAAVAMRHGAALLAHDTDFVRMAGVVALELDPASRA